MYNVNNILYNLGQNDKSKYAYINLVFDKTNTFSTRFEI